MTSLLTKTSEWLMLSAGVLILVSVPLIAEWKMFELWFAAKMLYLAGVVAMLIESYRYARR